MKYIIMQTDDGAKLPLIFPERMTHALMAQFFAVAIMRERNTRAQPISAGSVHIDKANVSGDSETLRLSPMKADDARIVIGASVEFMSDEATLLLLKKAGKLRMVGP